MKDHIFKTILLLFLMVLVPFFFVTPAQAAPGDYLFQWGPQHSLYAPMGVAVDGSGNVYVVDCFNQRIQKFNSSGAYITQWGNSGSGNGQFQNPWGVAVDGSGNIYVTDIDNSRVQVFDGTGTYQGQWGNSGTGDGQFRIPCGIASNGIGTIVYVADTENNRILAFVGYGGSTNSVTAVPDTGYHFVSWTYRRKIVSTSATLILTNVTTSQVITANFAPNHYTITFVTDGNGSITGTTSQTVDFSESTSSVTAVPSNGYRFVSWTGTNGFVSTDNPLVITGVTTNLKVKANLAR